MSSTLRKEKIDFVNAFTKLRVSKGYRYKMARDFSIDRLKGRMYTRWGDGRLRCAERPLFEKENLTREQVRTARDQLHAYIVRELASIFLFLLCSFSLFHSCICCVVTRARAIVSDTENCVKKEVNARREGELEMGRELDDAVAAATQPPISVTATLYSLWSVASRLHRFISVDYIILQSL